MSSFRHESNNEGLFARNSGQENNTLFYREQPHFRALLRKLTIPAGLLILPTVLMISFENIGRIIGQWIETDPAYLAQRLLAARVRFDNWYSHLGDLSSLGTFVLVSWITIAVILIIKAYFDWTHAFHSISQNYVIEAQKRLLQDEQSTTIEASIVVGASVRRTFIDKFFPVCGSVIVQTIDLEGEGEKILFQDVKDPYRMRDVILDVKKHISTRGR